MKITSNSPFYQRSFVIFFFTLFLFACSRQQVSTDEPVLDAGFPFQQKWTYQADKPIWTLASNDDNVILITDEKIMAVSPLDGRLLWKIEFMADTLSSSLLTKKKLLLLLIVRK